MTDIDDVIAFYRARLDEGEQWALAASKPYRYADGNPPVPPQGVRWTWVVGENWEPVTPDPVLDEFVAEPGESCNLATVEKWPSDRWEMRNAYANCIVEMDSAAAGHIVRHDPARVLKKVAAGRALIRLYEQSLEMVAMFQGHGMDGKGYEIAVESYANAIRLEASVWDDHEDWDPAWRRGWMDEILSAVEPLPHPERSET